MSLITLYTVNSGPGYTTCQAVPATSLGGYAAVTPWAGGVLGDLFNIAQDTDVADARADYRAVYVYNDSETDTATAVRVFVAADTAGAAGFSVGIDPRPVTAVDAMSPQAVDVATAYTAPAGVTFSAPASYAAGLVVGDLPPGYGRPVWFKRIPTGADGAAYDSATVTVQAADDSAAVRTVYWETAPYADQTRPLAPEPFVDYASPFLRVSVDYLTEGGARITWALDNQLVDAGPYEFTLQGSRSGIPADTDWFDIGPPAREPAYLLDDEKRLWGMSSTLFYRVVLTTATATYTSEPASVYDKLSLEQWLVVRDIIRKEEMMLRRFVGTNGFLLKAKRYGTRCDCTNAHTGEVGDSGHPTCYGTGIVGGYHAPQALVFVNMDGPETYEHVEYNEARGTDMPTLIVGRAIATVPVVHKDVWVAVGSDERYYVQKVNEIASFQTVPIAYSMQLRLAPRSDVIYTLPITRPVLAQPAWKTVTSISV